MKLRTIEYTTDLIKADSVKELENIAMLKALDFFGSGYKFEIQDYHVSHYGIHDSRPGAYITVEATRLR